MSARAERAPSAVAYWDDEAARYDRRYDLVGPQGYMLRSRLAAVVDAIGPGEGSVLDAGMGGGRLCSQLAAAGWQASGVDAAANMVELARTRLPEASSRLKEGTLEALPFPDATFDCVASTGALEYSDLPTAMAELSRVLRPGGRAVVTYPNPHAAYVVWKTGVYYPAVRLLKRLLRRPHPDLPRGFPTVPPPRFSDLLRRHGLVLEATTFTSYQPLLTPFDEVLPKLAEKLGTSCERRQIGAKLLSTQVVYSARKATG